MGDHIKLNSLCCSYNREFKSMLMKHGEGNNNQDLVWKFCVVEQNVQ